MKLQESKNRYARLFYYLGIMGLVFLLSNLNVQAAEVGDAFTENDINYEITSISPNEVMVVYKTPSYEGNVVIPESVSDGVDVYTVNEIDSQAFGSNVNLSSVEIPDTIETIGFGAFLGCTSLTSITLPSQVTTISNLMFRGCTSLREVISVSEITYVGSSAFYNCTALENTSDFLAAEYIGEKAFHYTRWYEEQADGLIYISNRVYVYKGMAPADTEIIFREDTTEILPGALSGQANIINVYIPDSVTKIGAQAFLFCDGLSYLTVPESTIYIGDNAFSECGLSAICVPNSVTTFGDGVFFRSSEKAYGDTTSDILGEAAKDGVTILELTKPVFTKDLPSNRIVQNGVATTLIVEATANETLSYQWYKNNLILEGETNAYIDVSSAGEYKVLVKNTIDHVYMKTMSSICRVTVSNDETVENPIIINDLQASFTLENNESEKLLIEAEGNGDLSYQWYKNDEIIENENKIYYEVDTAGSYKVVISNSLDGQVLSITSSTCIVKVNNEQDIEATEDAIEEDEIEDGDYIDVEFEENENVINWEDLISISAGENAFDIDVVLRITYDDQTKARFEEEFLENQLFFPFDLTMYVKGTKNKVQAAEGTYVVITYPIPDNLVDRKDELQVVCLIDGELVALETTVVEVEGVSCVRFHASHFSPYAIVEREISMAEEVLEVTDTEFELETVHSDIGYSKMLTIILSVFSTLALVCVVLFIRKKLKTRDDGETQEK